MVNLNLDIDEKVLAYTSEYVVRLNSDDKDVELEELYLTNKNIISVYEKSKGLFSGSETVVDRIPLDKIKVVDGDAQVMKVFNPDWDEGLQIFLNDGRRVQFCFDINNDLDAWISNVANATVGKTELIKDVKPEATGTSESIFDDLKDLKESAKRLASGIAAHANRTMQQTQGKAVSGQPVKEKPNYTPTRAPAEMRTPAESKSAPQKSEKTVPPEKTMFCVKCGAKIPVGYKFCSKCGYQTNNSTDNTVNNFVRSNIYEGAIHKCPNCGEVINSFTPYCPSCGHEFRDANASASIRTFAESLERANSEKMRISMIRNFPVPNTKEDIYEFMLLAAANFDETYYAAHMDEEDVSDAWLSKIEQCYRKASITLKGKDFEQIKEIYDPINEKITKAKDKWSQEQTKIKKQKASEEFQKSKLKKWLIFLIGFSVLMIAVAFNDKEILAGMVGILILILGLLAFLMGQGVIKEIVHNIRWLPAIMAFLLIVPYFDAYNGAGLFDFFDSTKDEQIEKYSYDYKEDVQTISWDELILGEKIPDIGLTEAKVVSNNEEGLFLYFYDNDISIYKSYVEECKSAGYTVEPEINTEAYRAYNDKGYHLNLIYNNYSDRGEISIDLDDPIKRNQIDWPKSELVKALPVPESLVGEVSRETSDYYSVYLVDMNHDDFVKYVNECMDAGFDVDYSKYDNSYSADNKDGASLRVEYEGFNTVYVSIDSNA